MWNRERDEAVRPTAAGSAAAASPPAYDAGPARQPARDNVHIGKSVVVKGALSGSEDLTIEGLVEGTIELRQNVLTIGPNGKITAKILAKSVVVQGHVHGNITAVERVEIRDSGSVDGDIVAPRVAIADGAHFRGSIDMQSPGEPKSADVKPAAKPADSKPVSSMLPPPGPPGGDAIR